MLAFGRLADDLVDSTSMPRVKRSELRQDEGSQVTAESEGDKADSVGLKDAMILAVTLHHLWITQYARLSYIKSSWQDCRILRGGRRHTAGLKSLD